MRQSLNHSTLGVVILATTIVLSGCKPNGLPGATQVANAKTQAARVRSDLYVPPDSVLLAERIFPGAISDSDLYPGCFGITTELAYRLPRSFPQVLIDYRTNLAAAGWDVSPLRDQVQRGADFFYYGTQDFLTVSS